MLFAERCDAGICSGRLSLESHVLRGELCWRNSNNMAVWHFLKGVNHKSCPFVVLLISYDRIRRVDVSETEPSVSSFPS